jgi:hypothetical protein
MRTKALIVLIVMLLSHNTHASEISIELPQLAGDYEARPDVPPSFGIQSRHCTITLPAELIHIDSLRFQISGQITYGLQHCEAGEPPTPYSADFAMSVFYTDSSLNFFMGSVRPSEGVFDGASDEIVFYGPGQPASLDILISRPIEIYLDDVGYTYCYIYADCYGTLTDVRIVLNGTVPTRSSTLGEIKALFR